MTKIEKVKSERAKRNLVQITLREREYNFISEQSEKYGISMSAAGSMIITQYCDALSQMDTLKELLAKANSGIIADETEKHYSASNQMQFNHSPATIEDREQIKLESKAKRAKK